MYRLDEVTLEDFRNLLDEYFKKPEKRQNLTYVEAVKIAQLLNKRINVPFVKETGEERIIVKIVILVDTFLYDCLPNEFYGLVRDFNNGIDDDEARELIKRLTKLANQKINIPWVSESVEKYIFLFVISIIVNAARRKWNIWVSLEEGRKT